MKKGLMIFGLMFCLLAVSALGHNLQSSFTDDLNNLDTNYWSETINGNVNTSYVDFVQYFNSNDTNTVGEVQYELNGTVGHYNQNYYFTLDGVSLDQASAITGESFYGFTIYPLGTEYYSCTLAKNDTNYYFIHSNGTDITKTTAIDKGTESIEDFTLKFVATPAWNCGVTLTNGSQIWDSPSTEWYDDNPLDTSPIWSFKKFNATDLSSNGAIGDVNGSVDDINFSHEGYVFMDAQKWDMTNSSDNWDYEDNPEGVNVSYNYGKVFFSENGSQTEETVIDYVSQYEIDVYETNWTFQVNNFNLNTFTASSDTVFDFGIYIESDSDYYDDYVYCGVFQNSTGNYHVYNNEGGDETYDLIDANLTGNISFNADSSGQYYCYWTLENGTELLKGGGLIPEANFTKLSKVYYGLSIYNQTDDESNISLTEFSFEIDDIIFETASNPYSEEEEEEELLVSLLTENYFDQFNVFNDSYWLLESQGGGELNVSNGKLFYNNSAILSAHQTYPANDTHEFYINTSDYNFTISIDVDEILVENSASTDTFISYVGGTGYDSNATLCAIGYVGSTPYFGYIEDTEGSPQVTPVSNLDGTLYARYDGNKLYCDLGNNSVEVETSGTDELQAPFLYFVHVNQSDTNSPVAGSVYTEMDNYNLTLSFLEEIPTEEEEEESTVTAIHEDLQRGLGNFSEKFGIIGLVVAVVVIIGLLSTIMSEGNVDLSLLLIAGVALLVLAIIVGFGSQVVTSIIG